MAEKLKLARKNAKLTQEEVSQVFGIKRASVSLWESSQPKSTKPNIRKLAKLAKLYKVSVKDLLEDGAKDEEIDSLVIKECIGLTDPTMLSIQESLSAIQQDIHNLYILYNNLEITETEAVKRTNKILLKKQIEKLMS
tara:strand:+ start:365 stop:778 length:414 start_codon:yes stop_codon:yes gene_type:complete